MRKAFFEALYKEMKENKDIYFVTADLGFGLGDKIKNDFHDRFINVQAAEQAMLGVGIGLTVQGKIAICYSITPFLLHRPFEAIKLYLHHESIPVKLVGSGRDRDYEHDSFSHFEWNNKFIDLMDIEHIRPEDDYNMNQIVKDMLYNNKPTFLSLKR